jgi:hypothetical protein
VTSAAGLAGPGGAAIRGHSSGISHASTRSFQLNNRNIDRRNDANTAKFARTELSRPIQGGDGGR